MKNKIVRLIALMLALVFCMLALAACKDDEEGGDGPQGVTGKGEAAFDGVSFEGKTVKICHSKSSEASRGGTDSSKYITAPDSEINDAIVRKAKERNDYVNGRLKINLVYSYIDDMWDTCNDIVKNLYDANDEYTPDVVIARMSSMFQLQLEGIFRNLNTEQFTNYFDFSAENGWYTEAMTGYAFGQDVANGGKVYLMLGDVFLDSIRSAAPLYVNEELLVSKGFFTDVSEFYDLICEGTWIWDELIGLSAQAYQNAAGSAIGKDELDDIGLLAMANGGKNMAAGTAMAFVYGSVDMELMTFENGQYKFNEANINGIFANYATKLKEGLFDTNAGYLQIIDDESHNTLRQTFARGRTLFCAGLHLFDLEGAALSAMKICPIPYPKMFDSDRYVVRSADGANIGAVLKNSKSFTPASAYFQYMCIKSEPVRTTYYDQGLGLK